ncbi:MAG: ZIP family metal transporter [Flavobacteriales bacterium]|nr:ZIP family metal transporter [Flavobacteriales bacterium]
MNEELLNYIILFSTPVIVGAAVFLLKLNISKNLKLLLSFSGAFLFTICILHLIPELYFNWNKTIGFFIMGGFFLQLILENFSKGIEHGHAHTHTHLGIFPFSVFFSLLIHSFVEGMALIEVHHASEVNHSHSYNMPLLIGISIHNIPVTMVLLGLMFRQQIKLRTQLYSLLIFALSAPIGLFFANHFNEKIFSTGLNFNFLLAISVGIFLHISTTILFETSEQHHHYNYKKMAAIIIGVFIAGLTLLL